MVELHLRSHIRLHGVQSVKYNENFTFLSPQGFLPEINGLVDSCVDMQHPLSAKVGTNFSDKRRSLGRYSSLADYKPQRVFFMSRER
jgi:hypothetical protein